MEAHTPLAFCSISALDRSLADAARLAAENGLDGVEVTARPPHLDPRAPLSEIRAAAKALRETGAPALAYGSYLGRRDALGADAHGREAGLREARVAAALGAPLVRVWADCVADDADQGFARVVETVAACCDAAREEGACVVVERHVGSFADTPERIRALFAAVGRENLALNYQVLDFLPQRLAAAQPEDARGLVPLARYFHLKNTRPAADGAGPMPPGGSIEAGVLDYRAILGAAFDAGYAGPLTIEFLSFERKPVEEKLAADVRFVRAALRELGRT